MSKIDVKYLGVVIGYTYDGEKIQFLDNELSKEIQKTFLEGHTIGLSQRRMGTVTEDGFINNEEIIEYNVINYFYEIKTQNNNLIEFSNVRERLVNYINTRINYFSGGDEMKSMNESLADSCIIEELESLKKIVNEYKF